MISAKRTLLVVVALAMVLLAVGVGPGRVSVARAWPVLPAADGGDGTLPYAGTLADPAGKPVADGLYDFSFALYAAETGGAPVAILGVVSCKVSAENGPIHPGDLLVTSSTPGHAMRADRARAQPGTILGKALESLDTGTGLIQVLVTLQ